MTFQEKMASYTEEELRVIYENTLTLETEGSIGECPFRDLYDWLVQDFGTYIGIHVAQNMFCWEVTRRHFEGGRVHDAPV